MTEESFQRSSLTRFMVLLLTESKNIHATDNFVFIACFSKEIEKEKTRGNRYERVGTFRDIDLRVCAAYVSTCTHVRMCTHHFLGETSAGVCQEEGLLG